MPKVTALVRKTTIGEDLARASELARDADSLSTQRGYRIDVQDWMAYCNDVGAKPLPADPAVVVAWLGRLEATDKSVSTARHRIAALNRLHRERKMDPPGSHPDVKRTLKGYAKRHAGEHKRKRAITPQMVATVLLDPDMKLRDKAIVAIGFGAGLRRSELAALTWNDVDFVQDGVVITIQRSKTDQEGEGAVVAIVNGTQPQLCLVTVLKAWHKQSKTDSVFAISTETINRLAKRIAKDAGEDPAEFGGHSFRAGFCTVAGEAGVGLAESMVASRHKDANTAATYVRPATALKNKAFRAVADALTRKT